MTSTTQVTSVGIVEKVMAFLNLGEAGKIQHFFDKLRKELTREIKALEKNIDTLKFNAEANLDKLKESLEDAQAELENVYLGVTLENVKTNELQDKFAATYWSNIEKAEDKVQSLKESIKKVEETLANKIKEVEEQISERKRRLDKIK